jgi:hypothetical protein
MAALPKLAFCVPIENDTAFKYPEVTKNPHTASRPGINGRGRIIAAR